MNKLYILLLLLISSVYINAQDRSFYVYVQNNSSNSEIKYPDRPEEGTFATNKIYTPGIGLQYDLYHGKVNSMLRLGYTLKGFKLPDAIQEYGRNFQIVDLKFEIVDKLHFFTFDLLVSYPFLKSKFSRPYISVGIQNGFLFAENTQFFQTYYEDMPGLDYFKDLKGYETYTLGGLLGVGYTIKELFFIEVVLNKDIVGIVRRPEVKVKNVLFSFNLGFNLTNLAKLKA